MAHSRMAFPFSHNVLNTQLRMTACPSSWRRAYCRSRPGPAKPHPHPARRARLTVSLHRCDYGADLLSDYPAFWKMGTKVRPPAGMPVAALRFIQVFQSGEVLEWLNRPVSKTGIRVSVSRVRNPSLSAKTLSFQYQFPVLQLICKAQSTDDHDAPRGKGKGAGKNGKRKQMGDEDLLVHTHGQQCRNSTPRPLARASCIGASSMPGVKATSACSTG